MRAVQLTAYGNPVEGLNLSTFRRPTLPARTKSSSASSLARSTRAICCSRWASMRCARAADRHRQ